MTEPTSAFGTTTDDTAGNPATNPVGALEQLVGDGKKFSDAEALAKGKLESDNFVVKLQDENKELREELDKRLNAEEILKKIQEESKTSAENTSHMSEDDVSNLVKTTVENMTAEQRRAANLKAVDDKLVELYGDKSADVVAQKAVELGMTVEQLADMAATTPQAALKLVGGDTAATHSARPADGSINTEAIQGNVTQGPAPDTYKYFDKLRKENPREYFSPTVQNRMMKLAQEKGDAFYS